MKHKASTLFFLTILIPQICLANQGLKGLGGLVYLAYFFMAMIILYILAAIFAWRGLYKNNFTLIIIAIVINIILAIPSLIISFQIATTNYDENNRSVALFPIILIAINFIPIIKAFTKK